MSFFSASKHNGSRGGENVPSSSFACKPTLALRTVAFVTSEWCSNGYLTCYRSWIRSVSRPLEPDFKHNKFFRDSLCCPSNWLVCMSGCRFPNGEQMHV
jgi:hypothetical protein